MRYIRDIPKTEDEYMDIIVEVYNLTVLLYDIEINEEFKSLDPDHNKPWN